VKDLKPWPRVEIISPVDGEEINGDSVTITVVYTDEGGGVTDPVILRNGDGVAGEDRGVNKGFKDVSDEGTFRRSFTIPLVDGENIIEAGAFSDERIRSKLDKITIIAEKLGIEAPDLYILSAGVSDYMNSNITLQYGASDAVKIANAFTERGELLFTNVYTTLLTDDDATKDNILDEMYSIGEKSRVEDVVIIFLAGHGVVIDVEMENGLTDDVYYFIPYEMRSFTDSNIMKYGLSAKELGNAIRNITASHRAFLLDTCHSGGATEEIALAFRGAEEERAIARLQETTGAYFLAAASEETTAAEAEAYDGGLFTYTVLEAINNEDGVVYMSHLTSYLDEFLYYYYKELTGEGHFPIIDYKPGSNFAVGGALDGSDDDEEDDDDEDDDDD
jgi:hypothetical protein